MSYYQVKQLKNGLFYIVVPAPGPTLSGRGRNYVIFSGPWPTQAAAQTMLPSTQVSWSAC